MKQLISLRGLATILVLSTTLVPASSADEPPKPPEPARTQVLQVDPKGIPSPAFFHRLLPLESERTPGDAAPIYLRLDAAYRDPALDDIDSKTTHWLETPLDTFPVAEARTYVAMWGNRLRQVEFGSRRQTCHWDYTIPEERDRVFAILLPDVQYTRRWVRLLAVKVRVEALDHHFDASISTLETGLAFARHVGEGPFLMNGIFGANNAHILLNELETLIGQPGAPNLYWALTALPRPLIPFRDAAERELAFGRWMIPELNDLDQPRTPLEWSSRLTRLHARLIQFEEDARNLEKSVGIDSHNVEPIAPLPEGGRFRAEILPEARKFLEAANPSAEKPSDAEAIIRYLAHLEAIYRDAETKAAALPYPEAGSFYDEADRQRLEAKRGPLRTLYRLLEAPVVRRGFLNETLLDRRIAALRVIEAIRRHAAQVGHLPKALEEIQAVPIPLDPLSGKPFDYQLNGETATLLAPSGLPPRTIATYQVTLRR